ncbi:hypothetical protein AOV_02420 [Anaplasma ovis str. Haibei]|uniref:Uncharacterized protein n=1 Tax=Anaplasma ovis str. Haibei TaxID=1248439 RepID=A0A2Z2L861_9RICK|nr:hypothetical protein AOV_02420 [Anaplasma ovis str. Haibei]
MPASPQGGVKLSSSAKTGKALAHRIAVANRAHAISGVLLNIGKLLCAVAVICAIALAGGGLLLLWLVLYQQ